MVRESDDAQLDNIARTVFANNNADYHIAYIMIQHLLIKELSILVFLTTTNIEVCILFQRIGRNTII